MAVSTDIRAEWRESRWLRLLCRLRKASSHEMGILSLRTAEACTLGRLLGKDEAGNVIFMLRELVRSWRGGAFLNRLNGFSEYRLFATGLYKGSEVRPLDGVDAPVVYLMDRLGLKVLSRKTQ